MYYIGNTQQTLKARIDQHLDKTKRCVNKGLSFDSFSKHFSSHFLEEREGIGKLSPTKKVTVGDIRALVRTEILWQGNPISCMKTFGTTSCCLCMKERILLYQAFKENKELKKLEIINSASELYGACRHKTRFHRFNLSQNPSTDDGGNTPEKSLMSSNNSTLSEPTGHAKSVQCSPVPYGQCVPITVFV